MKWQSRILFKKQIGDFTIAIIFTQFSVSFEKEKIGIVCLASPLWLGFTSHPQLFGTFKNLRAFSRFFVAN
jgi:hypothetical protein